MKGKRMRVSKEVYEKLLNNSIDQKKNKYNNTKVEYKGIRFDSIKEMKHYQLLEYLQKIGEIKELKLQVPYELIPKYKINNKTVRKTTYIADFTYITTNDDKLHIVDTKGFKTDVYRLKKKLFEYKYGVEVEEV
jgi:hypothetical protein